MLKNILLLDLNLTIQFSLYEKISGGLRMELRRLMTADSFIIQFMLAETFLITHYTQGTQNFCFMVKISWDSRKYDSGSKSHFTLSSGLRPSNSGSVGLN